MATINEITSGAQYRGDAALGGGVSVGITVDPSPLARLETFTYYRDRDFWEKKQKQDVMAARQIADIAAYDVNSPFKEYTQDLTKDLTKLRDYFRNTPDASVYNPNNPQAYMDGQEMLGKFSNKRKHATANDTLYNSAKAKLDIIPDAQTREREMRALGIRAEKLFSNGVEDAYNQQFEVVPPPTPEKSIIPSVSMTTRSMVVPLPNSNIINEITYGDPEDLMAKSIMQASGGDIESIKTQEWFKKMSPAEQKYELEKAGSTKLVELENTAAKINNLMGEWAAQVGGNIDVNTIDLNKLPDNSFGDNIRSARAVNDQIDELNLLVLQGKIPDPSGGVRKKPYSKLNLNDGFSSAELIFMKSLQDSKNPLIQKVGKTISNNDNAIQAMQDATTRRGQNMADSRFWAGFNKSSDEDILSADAVIREVSDAVNSGTPHYIKTKNSSGKIVTENRIAIADPNLLREFSTLDKDGNVTNTADLIHFDEKSNKMSLVYYKKERVDPSVDATDKTMKIVTDGSNNPIVDRQIEMQPTQWMGQITRRKNPNKDIGGVNTLIDKVYNKYGRNLKNLATEYKGGATTTTNTKTTESGKVGGSNKETPEQRAKRIANE